ncbi:MAG TPA: DUF1318 domain-containing protein [Myxococcota bacterium]|nr:DUF1318 domain-containing protein [Myxococcota bacterium]HRY96270.1 DUF1318 domain-containing protein [Myxococcota bacterium]HSA23820.1 DUF1318 domain-containing protein [Myxococcota bacterium]
MRAPRDPVRRCVHRLGLGLALLAGVGCVEASIQVVDERTALENQILGAYEQLDRDLQLVASVRAVGADGQAQPAPRLSDVRQRAVQARQTQQFNRDDLEELKAQGCLGEGLDAMLAARPCAAQAEPATAQRLERLVAAENQARRLLLEFVVTTSPDLTRADLPQLVEAAARAQREQAAPGTWLQEPGGEWRQKP